MYIRQMHICMSFYLFYICSILSSIVLNKSLFIQSIEVALQAPFEHPPSSSVCDLTDNSSSNINGSSPPSQDAPCDQLLPDFYAEHVTLAMNQERRRAALSKARQYIEIIHKLKTLLNF